MAYIKIKVYPQDYGPRYGMERYHFVEIEDSINDLPEDDRECILQDAVQQAIEEAVYQYVEADEQVCEGNLEDDADY